jgi:rubredoxin
VSAQAVERLSQRERDQAEETLRRFPELAPPGACQSCGWLFAPKDRECERCGATRGMRDLPADGRCPFATMDKPSCKKRSCPVCGVRWARNQQQVLRYNLNAFGGPVATLAITAPGKDVLPWDEDYCRRLGRKPRADGGRHSHAGPKGCRVQGRPLREWCNSLPWRWKKMREAAALATKRELGFKPQFALCRVWEPQKRGAPHLHLVLPYGTFLEKRAAQVFRNHLERLAPAYEFGDVQRKLQPITGENAARYLANYLTGRNSAKKNSIRVNIADPRLPRSLVWLTPRLTRVTAVTMRTLRRARHLLACMDGRYDQLPVWQNFDEAIRSVACFRTVYPKRAGPLPSGFDLQAERELAQLVDQYIERRRLRPLFYEEERLQKFVLRMTRDAFRATAAAKTAEAGAAVA